MLTTVVILALILGISSSASGQSKQEIVKQIESASMIAGVDPDLAVAIATVESSLNPNAKGSLGEIGLFQLRPEFHPVVKDNIGHNILTGVAYLAELKTKCWVKFKDAWFVCFNYGPHRKLKHPRKTEYFRKVTREMNRLRVKRYLSMN